MNSCLSVLRTAGTQSAQRWTEETSRSVLVPCTRPGEKNTAQQTERPGGHIQEWTEKAVAAGGGPRHIRGME